MSKFILLLFLFTAIVFVMGNPLPDYDQDGQEILNGADTRYYGLPFFWYRRPLTDDDGDDYGGNNGGNARPTNNRRRKKVPVYQTAGAAWGR